MTAKQKALLFRFLLMFAIGIQPQLVLWLNAQSTDWRALLVMVLITAGGTAEKLWQVGALSALLGPSQEYAVGAPLRSDTASAQAQPPAPPAV